MIKTSLCSFKGVDAYTIESGKLKAVFTGIGSRMVSLLDKYSGRELMVQGRSEKLASGNYDADYSLGDPAGFDDMFPTIDECYYERYPWKGIKIPDHGEVWSLDWTCNINEAFLEMSVCGIRFPYRISKKISFRDENALRIEYSVFNLCEFDMDFLWSAHAMFAMDKGSRVLLPGECRKAVTVYSQDASIGSYGNSFEIKELLKANECIGYNGNSIDNKELLKADECIGYNGNSIDNEELLKAKSHNSGEKYKGGNDGCLKIDVDRHGGKYMDKFFIGNKIESGWCGVEYPIDGASYIMRFPTETVPYLGILLTQGFEIGSCAMLEPCTAAYDRPDRARAFGCFSILKGRGKHEWYIEIEKVT